MGIFSKLLLALSGSLLLSTTANAGSSLLLTTPRGATIEIIEDKPSGDGPFPAVILGSGSNYDARQPLQEQVASQLAKAGFATIRFNWAYHVQDRENGKPSLDRRPEIEDMQTAIAYAKQQSWVDKQRIAVAGKSLGSIIGWRVFQADPELKAAILLTPVCRTPPGLAQQYANAADETRPSLWLLGNADPVCVTSDLYGYLGTKPNPARIAIVDGNHALAQEGQPADPGNLALAAKIAAQFAVSAIRQEVNQIYTGK